MSNSINIYRQLLRFYPARFREEFAGPMERQFSDDYRGANGSLGRAFIWLRAIADLAVAVPQQTALEIGRDLQYSFAWYRRRPFTALFAIAALALAIGLSTAVFSVLNALLLRSLPFSDPERLVELWNSPIGALSGRATFLASQHESHYLQTAAAFSVSEMNLVGHRDALRVKVAETSANFFDTLGATARVGRTFAGNEDSGGNTGVAVISHALWLQWFGGSPDFAGASLHLNGTLLTVIGVAPPRFDYPGNTDIWTPTVFDFERIPHHGALMFQTVARLKPGVSIATAQQILLAEAHPGPQHSSDDLPKVIPIRDKLAGPVRQATWILGGLVLLVLMTASANVAQLLLSRTIDRRQELVIRAALGASRARLVQQLITESIAFTSAGALLGLLVAAWSVKIAATAVPPELASQAYEILDWHVLFFAMFLAVLVGVICGLLSASHVNYLFKSRDISRTEAVTPELGVKRLRALLISLQAGLTLVLLTTSLAAGQSFLTLLHTDLGLRADNVATLNVSLQGTRYVTAADQWQYYSEVLARLRAVPGVLQTGAVSYLPFANNAYMAWAFTLDSGQKVERVVSNASMPGYFGAIGTKLLAGRDFTFSERPHSRPVVIVNEAFAKASGLGRLALGRTMKTPWSSQPYLIVGIVATTRFSGPSYPGGPQVFVPLQEEPTPTLTFVAKTSGNSANFLPGLRQAIRTLASAVPVYDVKTLDERLTEVLARPKFYTAAILFLTLLATILAAVGIYAAAANAVGRRKRELGLRMALGGSPSEVRRMVMRESLIQITYGTFFGIAGALATDRFLQHLIEGAKPVDPWICASAGALLLLTALFASGSATMEVLAIDPATTLRTE